MRASSEEEYEAWVEAIERARGDIAERDEAAKDTGPLSEERRLARAIFESNSVQYFIGLAIFLAYVQAIAAARLAVQSVRSAAQGRFCKIQQHSMCGIWYTGPLLFKRGTGI